MRPALPLLVLVVYSYGAQPNTFPHGFPPIPLEGYPTYDMRKSTVVYFVGNDTGAYMYTVRPAVAL